MNQLTFIYVLMLFNPDNQETWSAEAFATEEHCHASMQKWHEKFPKLFGRCAYLSFTPKGK